MNTNCIVDRQDYFAIKGIDHYFIYNGNLYHGDKKDPVASWEKITSPFDIEFDDICEVRDFLEAFHYYPDTENDYLFHADMSYSSKDDEFVKVDALISNYNVLYVTVKNPETKKFMIVPCMRCIHDNSDIDTDDADYCIDYPHILINEKTKRDITDDIVAYDSKSGKHVVFMGTLDTDFAFGVPVAHIVNKYKVERIVDFSYQNDIDLYETISNWFKFKEGKDDGSYNSDQTDYTFIVYGTINATPDADDKKVTIHRTLISNKKLGDHLVVYASYKNPGDKYISLYQVNTNYPNVNKFINCCDYISDHVEV